MDKPDVFIGIDVGRHHHQCSFVDGERKPIAKTLRIGEDRDGFQALKLEMDNIIQKTDGVRFHIGLEATGHYHQNLMAFLQAIDGLDVEVTCINPVQTKRFIQMQMLREQNDKVDARAIAEYMCGQRPAPTPQKLSDMQPLRDLSRLRCQLITQRTMSLNQLHAILDHVCSEFEQIFTNVKSESLAWALLACYPCSQNLITAKTSQLISVQAKKGGRYLGKERALLLKKFAKQTVGSSRGEVYAFQVKILVQNVKSL